MSDGRAGLSSNLPSLRIISSLKGADDSLNFFIVINNNI